jgi:hypothetical protein
MSTCGYVTASRGLSGWGGIRGRYNDPSFAGASPIRRAILLSLLLGTFLLLLVRAFRRRAARPGAPLRATPCRLLEDSVGMQSGGFALSLGKSGSSRAFTA